MNKLLSKIIIIASIITICVTVGFNGYQLMISNDINNQALVLEKKKQQEKIFLSRMIVLIDEKPMLLEHYLGLDRVFFVNHNGESFLSLSSGIHSYQIDANYGVTEESVDDYIMLRNKIYFAIVSGKLDTAEKLIQESELINFFGWVSLGYLRMQSCSYEKQKKHWMFSAFLLCVSLFVHKHKSTYEEGNE